MKSAVVITGAPALDYFHNYVALPYDYGRHSYFARRDVKAIRETVFNNLDELDARTGWKSKINGRKGIVKPNLVFVTPKGCYRFGYDIPQTTDPRVFEAVIACLKDLTDDIIIGEGSGLVTWAYFKIAGYDRIGKYYNVPLVAFEEQATDRYYCPKAEVGKDVYVPRSISEVIRGERLYVSVPKMKCNIYTQVTLGFKNAMGTLSCNMRYKNHTWQIDKKLTDLLYLFKPDLTVIDGIIGGEGNSPGPVRPVEINTIVSGTNSVEVDRVVTEMMGFDPLKNKLLIEATAKGFGDETVEVYGKKKVVPFLSAEQTLYSDRFKQKWPHVKLYVGHDNARAPKIADIHGVTPATVKEMEASCAGGCISSIATTMEILYASRGYWYGKKRKLAFIVGPGTPVNGQRYWFDENGKAYTLAELGALKVFKVGIGECTSVAKDVSHVFARGCGEVTNLAMRVALSMGIIPGQMDPVFNPDFFLIMAGMVRKYVIKVWRVIKDGELTEPVFDAYSDRVEPLKNLKSEDADRDWIAVPTPKLSLAERWAAIKGIRFLANFLF